MLYTKPQCYECKHDKNASCKIGQCPACAKYLNGRPRGVFYEGKKCAKFEPQQINVDGRKKRQSFR